MNEAAQNPCPKSIPQAAFWYRDRGRLPIPLHARSKRPIPSDWTNYQPNDAAIRRDFLEGCNIGVLLGEPSGGLIDIDLDCSEARDLASAFLPRTDWLSGRKSSPRSHYWYIVDRPPKTQRYRDPTTDETLVELRSTGAQTAVPPSVHPSGEQVVWETDDKDAPEAAPPQTSGTALERAVRRLAAVALLARHWPRPGSRHDVSLALSGMLLRGGWSAEEAAEFVREVARAAGDEEWCAREADVSTTTRRLAQGEQATGAPTLAGILGDPVITAVRQWLEFGVRTNGGDISGSVSCEVAWDSPVEFNSTDLHGPELNLDALPEPIRCYVEETASSYQISRDFVAACTLGVLAAAAAGRAEVAVGKTHTELLNLYIFPTAAPGERKVVLREIVHPLAQAEKELAETGRLERCEQANLREITKARIDHLRRKATKTEDPRERESVGMEAAKLEEEMPQDPVEPRLLIDDATPEAMVRVLAEQRGVLAAVSEEAGSFLDVLAGRYSPRMPPPLDVVLKGYDGGAIRVDRISRDPIYIERPVLTLLMTPQPAILDRFAEIPEFRGRGFLARCCFVLPGSLVGSRMYQNRSIDAAVRRRYAGIVQDIARLPIADPAQIPKLRLEREPLEVWIEFADQLEKAQAEGGELASVRDWASKHAGRAARIAGLFHMVHHHRLPDPWTRPICIEDVGNAWTVCHWLQAHALAAFDRIGADPTVQRAKKILAWIRRHRLERFSLKQLHDHDRTVNRAEDFLPALENLDSRGFVRREPDSHRTGRPGRRPSPVFEVSPRTLSQNSQNR